MRYLTVMNNTIGLKLLSTEAKKFSKAVIYISKKMLKTCLRVQYNAAVFPIYFIYGGLKYVYQQSYTSDNENEPTLEPKSDVIVDAVKKLRNSVVSGMNGISSSKCDPQIDSKALNDDSVDDDQNAYRRGGELIRQIPDVAVEGGCSTIESSDRNPIAFMGVGEFTGSDLMWDIPIISAKAKHFTQCLKEGKRHKIAAARKALEKHSDISPIPKTRREYDAIMNDARNGVVSKLSVSKSKVGAQPTNIFKCNEREKETLSDCEKKCRQKKVEFCINDDASCQHFPRHKITKCRCDSWLAQGKTIRREIGTINKKLKKIHETCSSLLGGLSTLNEDFLKVIAMKDQLATLEFQVDEGNKLLQEVESDRFIMKCKLSALEKLINEEQEFLCDAFESSCESGFYESENNAGTVGEL